MVEVAKAASEYVKMGFSVIPTNLDKTPLLREWRSFQKRHAMVSEIVEWYTMWPDAGVAIITGGISNLVVVDLDTREAVEKIKNESVGKPPAVITGKGYHLYYRYRSGVGNSVNRELGLDIRGEGGYVIAPPSKHPSGKTYIWSQRHIWNTNMIDLPDLFFVKQPEYRGNETDEQHWATDLFCEGVEEGGRNDACARLAGRLLLKGLGEAEVFEVLHLWNEHRNNPPLPGHEVRRTVESIAASHRRKKQ